MAVHAHRADRSQDRDGVEHLDVLIIGAGLSGIGAASHLQDRLPHKSYAILEAREAIGGTWDLFRYPGIRSDSDMHTLGYRFRPWPATKAIADGPAILSYVQEVAAERGIDEQIRFGHRVVGAEWSSEEARWTVDVERTDTGETVRMTCGFLMSCAGYYRYDEGYSPHFEGRERFRGQIVHPQFWPEDLDYEGKRVVVIGSGATAVTLVPAMTDKAAHVTMLQRSPTYVVSIPGEDPLAVHARRLLPDPLAFRLARWKNVLLQLLVFRASRRWPGLVKSLIRKALIRRLPEGFEVDRHFRPSYNPWDQRMCVVPDGDLFEAICAGRASIVTDRVETFTEKGIRLASGEELEADVIVTATGLNLQAVGGVRLVVDGQEVSLPETMAYKAMMLSGVPNLAFVVGYTNASWTLKADLVCEYVCRLLAHMESNGYDQCVPVNDDPTVEERPLLDFSSGYVQRSIHAWPKQGSKAPWLLRQSYPHDLFALRRGDVDDGTMRFLRRSRAGERQPAARAA